ncbi:lytic transglycosylase domain-containing protein [Roseibium sp. MMSF_3544]|uniref:lytic transglycosylase domain-containing protein n=1 Tax=unclassified Roseibium TaxID=2629323 RepID=UPI0027402F23|nr:lytic transglycosylase domain-containing protein [Roseibium sp. MMSF_3544]
MFNRHFVLRLSVLMIAVIASNLAAAAQVGPWEPRELEILLKPRNASLSQDSNLTIQQDLISRLADLDPASPDWPIYTFLRAEAHLERREIQDALELYKDVIQASATRLNSDTLGGTAIAPFAVYRWLSISVKGQATFQTNKEEVRQVAAWTIELMASRLGYAVSAYHPNLPRLPLLEEAIFHLLSEVAFKAEMHDEAGQYYLYYLSKLRSENKNPQSDPLYRFVLDEKIVSKDRIALIRGRHFVQFAIEEKKNKRSEHFKKAIPFLEEAAKSEDSQVAVEAMFWMARATPTSERDDKEKVLDWYEKAYRYSSRNKFVEEALFRKGIIHWNMGTGHKETFERVLKEFPKGEFADDALFNRALAELIENGLEAAKPWFIKLQDFEGENDRVDSASLLPALSLIWKNTAEADEEARLILEKYLERHPQGELINRARFWLGRIAEDNGQYEVARQHFQICFEKHPFDYYGIRALMHLHAGKEARRQLLPEDAELMLKLRRAYAQLPTNRFYSQAPVLTKEESISEAREAAGTKKSGKANRRSLSGPYKERVESALGSGLYRAAMKSEIELLEFEATRRVEEFAPAEIDAYGLFTRIAVILSLRQEALTAVAVEDTPQTRLYIADAVARYAEDWPLSMTLLYSGMTTYFPQKSALMNEPGFLRVSYPTVYESAIIEQSQAYRVDPKLLYAVMRNESRFYAAALSHAQALGLFQFIPSTFESLDLKHLSDGTLGQGWKLSNKQEGLDRVAFLQNADNSIYLGARWFGNLLLPNNDNNELHALMEHHSGGRRVSEWKNTWEKKGWLNDVELMVESFRTVDLPPHGAFSWGIEARVFVRGVVTDYIIASALGLYDEQ